MKNPIHYSISLILRNLKSLFILSSLLILFIFCRSTYIDKEYVLKIKEENFLIYALTEKKSKDSQYTLQEDFIKTSLKSVTFSQKKFISDSIYQIFHRDDFQLITNGILKLSENSDFLLLILKTEDLINPYTRLYRDRLKISITENSIELEFIEVQKNLIFLSQFQLADWANPKEEFNCDKSLILKISDDYPFQTEIQELPECPKIPRKIVFMNTPKKILQEIPQNKEKNIEDRLNQLEDLFKKKIITKEEYEELRKKILSEL